MQILCQYSKSKKLGLFGSGSNGAAEAEECLNLLAVTDDTAVFSVRREGSIRGYQVWQRGKV
jgi:hypothetical protein